jgi:Arc/MetJ-type ribon-helix-helix transcriptional regulator
MVDFWTMKLTVSLPDNVAKRVCRLKNPDDFVRRAVEKALEQEQLPLELATEEKSKWARLVETIESESTSLGDYYDKFKKDLAEVRRDFSFRHDEPE